MELQKNKLLSFLKRAILEYKINLKKEFSLILISIGIIITVLSDIILGTFKEEMLMQTIFLSLMLGIELFNTSLEIILDLKSKDYNILIKKAKDTASASEFVVALVGFILIGFNIIRKIMMVI